MLKNLFNETNVKSLALGEALRHETIALVSNFFSFAGISTFNINRENWTNEYQSSGRTEVSISFSSRSNASFTKARDVSLSRSNSSNFGEGSGGKAVAMFDCVVIWFKLSG